MKKTILTLAAVALLAGCGLQNTFKHVESSLIGLRRVITLYDANGGVIKRWATTAKVEDNGGTAYFIVNGKAVTIAGTFIIEEQ